MAGPNESTHRIDDPALLAGDPFPHYRELRSRPGLQRDAAAGLWVATRLDDVVALSRDSATFCSSRGVLPADLQRQLMPRESIIYMDPPEHAKYRKLVQPAFAPGRLRALEADIRRIVRELLAAVEPGVEVDFVAEFSSPLPIIVIAEMLGVPGSDRDRFKTWSDAVIEAGTEGEPSPGTATGATAAAPAAAPSQAASQRQAPTSLQTSTGELSGPDPSSQNRKLTADADRAAALGSETALAPASPEPATTLVAANVNSATINPPATGSLAMPWLVTGALAATTAAAAASAAPTPWAPPATQAATPEPTTPSAAQQEMVAAAGEALAPPVQQKTAQRTQPTAPEVTLIPEVVDEPELFEVHQADPRLAEELDLTVMEPEPPIAMTAAEIVELPSTSLSAAAAIASAAILGTTTGPAAEAKTPTPLTWQEKQTIKPESGAESAPGHQLSAAPGESQSLLSLTGEALDTAAEPDVLFELFRNPPAPVEEEDPELLLGLLRVLVSAESAGDGG